jgi:3-dehydroquinate synthase
MRNKKQCETQLIDGKSAWAQLQQLLISKYSGHIKLVITDTNTFKYCLPVLNANVPALAKATVIKLTSSETTKSIESVALIIKKLIKLKASKQTVIINLGGGVVTDLGAFCAAIYQRGIPCIQVPTTLMAMTDAALGGKTGVNFAHLKNYIGTITPARSIIIYPPFLVTLPVAQQLSGMTEVFKHALIADKKLYDQLLKSDWQKPISPHLLKQSIDIKLNIVAADLLENNKRKLLNAGHTVGHAIESFSHKTNMPMLHGHCIAAGLIVECYISHVSGLLPLKYLIEITHCLHQHFNFMPFTNQQVMQIIKLMYYDKKNTGAQINFSLIKKPGQALINCVADESVIKNGFLFFNQS